MDIINVGSDVTVTNLKGETETLEVKQLPLRQYKAAFQKIDDEFALTAVLCGKPESWIYELDPRSYRALRNVARGENAEGFFEYADRQRSLLMERLNSIDPKALMALTGSQSNPSSTELHLRPV